jgi:hypothetical protein
MKARLVNWVPLSVMILAGTQPPVQAGPTAQAEPHVHAPPSDPDISIEDEVLQNLQNLQLGPVTVADLDPPKEFLRRVSDRIIRSSFEDRYRIVLADPKPGEEGQRAVLAPPPVDVTVEEPAWKRPLLVVAGIAGLLFVIVGIVLLRRHRSAA